jgi:hypothetical protein
VILLSARYYNGDFESAYKTLRQLMPLEYLATLTRKTIAVVAITELAYSIHEMEGEALHVAKYDTVHKVTKFYYPGHLFYLGEYDEQLARTAVTDFTAIDVLVKLHLITLDDINQYLSTLYEKDHLNRVQVSYLRAQQAPLSKPEIDKLITVNPYTSGLKLIMRAFIETNISKTKALYQEGIKQLEHIKYFYVEAQYFYAQFLQEKSPPEFDSVYDDGLALAQKHNYRFLIYRFEQLKNLTDKTYDSRDYPLPDSVDFSDYIQLLIKFNRQRNK